MQLKKKTLVILTPGFPGDEADSTCIPDRQIFVKKLKENFPLLNIVILAFQYPFQSKTTNWHGMQVMCLNGRNKGRLNRLVTWYNAWKALNQLKRENHLIGLLSFWIGECSLIAKLFGEIHSLRYHFWILGQDAKLGNKYVKVIRPRGEELIALSNFLSDEFYKNYAIKPLHIIPNGIDPQIFSSTSIKKDIDVLAAGSLIPLKQFHVFLQIIKDMKGYFPDIKAIIAGHGPEKNRLQALVETLELKQNVLLPGEKPHQQVLQLMQRTRVFLHPSLYEGFSSVCLEALYAGAHVVSFCKPMKEDVKHWHVVTNENEMLQKAIEILHDPAADHSSVMPFSMNDNAKMVMELYRD